MTRTLPWERKSRLKASPSQAQSPTTITATTPKQSNGSPSPTLAPGTASPGRRLAGTTPTPLKKQRMSLGFQKARASSSSPPPAAPTESFMIDGLENDDAYRMVEDEFLSVARTFTAHLHAAEYQRQKHLARSQNEETIRNISRPVTGVMSDLVRLRNQARELDSKQRKGVKRLREGSTVPVRENVRHADGRVPWEGTALQGLMEEPRGKVARLSASTATASRTRAAAGFQEGSPVKAVRYGVSSGRRQKSPGPGRLQHVALSDTESDEDDLGRAPRPSVPKTTVSDSTQNNASGTSGGLAVAAPPKAPVQRGREATKTHTALAATLDESDDPDAGFLRNMRQRRARRKR